MLKTPLRIGIVGLGFGWRVHLPAFLSVEGAQVAGLAGSGPDSFKRVGSVPEGVMAFPSWRELVEDNGIDAVSVAIPPAVQAEVVNAALDAGKHVFCEKPFGRNSREAAVMCQRVVSRERVGVVGFQFRMEEGFAALRREIASGTIGKIFRTDVTWLTGGRGPATPWSWQNDSRSGGGVIESFASHVADYLPWITGGRIVGVSARSEVVMPTRTDSLGSHRDVTAEDNCTLLLTFDNGITASVKISNCHPTGLGHRVEIDGEKGKIVFFHEAPFTTPPNVTIHTQEGRQWQLNVNPTGFAESGDSRLAPFTRLAELFVHSVRGKPLAALPTFQDGLAARKILDAIHASIEKNSYVAMSVP